MKYIFACFCCFILSSCATIPDQAYHKIKCADDTACSKAELDVKINPVTNMVVKNGWSVFTSEEVVITDTDQINRTSFNSFYLEYDEEGKKFEGNRQLDIIKHAIDTSDKPVYLVVYVHGWHNNADTSNKKSSFDTTAFPYLLARRSYQYPEMDVIGVYVGWRGAKYKFTPTALLTPLDRARAADFIGKEGEVRDDLVDLVNYVEKSAHSGYSLIMAHSFGSRLLSQAFMDDLANTKSIADWPLGRQSLLVNLNPAIGADAFDEIYSDMPGLGENLQRPLWINLTSKDDDTVKKIFPNARFLLQDLSGKPYSGVNDTIGHYMPYLSHEVTVHNKIDKNAECNFINEEQILNNEKPWFEIPVRVGEEVVCATRHLYLNKQSRNNESRYYTTVLRPLYENPTKITERNLGYMWNFRVDESLIDHSDLEKEHSKNGKHNAFVQTTLGRMLDDMLFTPPEKPLG
ncbi:hypothetical protein IEE84_02415 [Psychrobacter sp. 28M-43]|uniref:hypothetical protein n=1 Tax=Psychrobacter sp. 28M-43 TaxID=2772254 RepID=UPI00168D7FA6|nr:hypothetical protein [Psychrobacter sp. 28M-43]QOD13173.1 hypothetical protein IEE84_02415 [Psychrobacter sp. 28M-43]